MKPLMLIVMIMSFLFCRNEGSKKVEPFPNDMREVLVTDTLINHLVFLNLKDHVDQDSLINVLNRLREIPHLKSFSIGKFLDLADPKSLSQYNICLNMTFLDKQAYESYQKDSLHLSIIKETRHLMAGPPSSYDYIDINQL